MRDDTPTPPKVRRSRAELAELMVEGGVAVLAEQGIEVQISSVTYARVFEHLERTTGIRVTYGSVHERIWDSAQDYQLSVVDRAGVWDRPDPADPEADSDGWAEWVAAAVALVSGPPDATVPTAARSGILRSYPRLPDEADASAVLALLCTAVADGLALRAHLTGEPLPVVTLPTGPDDAPEEWRLLDLARWALTRALVSGDPTDRP